MWEKIIKDFVTKKRRNRFLEFAQSKKRRDDLFDEILHVPSEFDERCIIEIKPNEQNINSVLKVLKSMGANGKCWSYSRDEYIDEQYIEIKKALEHILGTCIESFLYFEKQGVAYYEGGHCDRVILKKLR